MSHIEEAVLANIHTHTQNHACACTHTHARLKQDLTLTFAGHSIHTNAWQPYKGKFNYSTLKDILPNMCITATMELYNINTGGILSHTMPTLSFPLWLHHHCPCIKLYKLYCCSVIGVAHLWSVISAKISLSQYSPSRLHREVTLSPQRPFCRTNTVSPGSTIFMRAVSMAACPVPDTARVTSFWVWKAYCKPALVSSMMRTISASNSPSRGCEPACRIRGGQFPGPAPSSNFWGTLRGTLSEVGGGMVRLP